jgi:D-threo-aldose 1-dehydrogenase
MDFSLLIAGPFASGSGNAATHNYAPPSPDVVDRVRRIEAVCREHDVPLRSAALQFSLGHPRVAAVAAGAVTPDEAADNAVLMTRAIPDSFWDALRAGGLIGPDIATPKAGQSGADR